MVCVLQSKLPWSSAVFQLYCQPFFFPLKPLTFYTFYCWDRASPLLFYICVVFVLQIHFWEFSLSFFVEELRFIFRCRNVFRESTCVHMYELMCVCVDEEFYTDLKAWNCLWVTFAFNQFSADAPRACTSNNNNNNKKEYIIAQEMRKKEKKGEQTHRGRQEETEKELYHVYYAPAGEFKCVRLRWNRAGVIIISYCLLDRTLKWSCHFIYTQTTVWFTPKHTRMHTHVHKRSPLLTSLASPVE